MAITSASAAALVRAAFDSRDVTGLCGLLGFAAAPITVSTLLEPSVLKRAGIVRIASRGTRGTLVCYELHGGPLHAADVAQVARALRSHNLSQFQLCVFVSADWSELVLASFGLGETLSSLRLHRDRLHASDLEALLELAPVGGERGAALAARHGRALDRSKVTRRFFADFAAQRDALATAWSGIASGARRDREQLALLLLSRLMFLYFLQCRGHLAGDASYLVRRFRAWHGRSTFYAGALQPLFFCVLNRRPERRPARARVFGDLPYLNGGLFERHLLERKHSRIDLDNDSLGLVFDELLERYRFTAHEAADAAIDGVLDLGVDPEMLGRVFEELMAAHVRETTGTYYTPAATVDKLVCAALTAHLAPRIGEQAATSIVGAGSVAGLGACQPRFAVSLLRETTVLDPACGSGAFLLGALSRLARARSALTGADAMAVRRQTVADSLYGVDLQSDAALLCALRLWLALVPGGRTAEVQPLPNLDRQVRQGDSLIDPLELRTGTPDAEIRACAAELQPASLAYVTSEPEQRPALQRALARVERRLARAWIATHTRRLTDEIRELRAAARQFDLFGRLTPEARAARRALAGARQRGCELQKLARGISKRDERPFFSFGVHFAAAALRGFDIVLCNPPWVRSHNWPRSITSMVRTRFRVCRSNQWQPPHGRIAIAGGNQIDLALLFLERAIELLAPAGILGIILPAKFMRSLSGAAARRLLLEHTEIISIEDHSLDQRSIFTADAFAAVIVARKRAPSATPGSAPIETACIKRAAEPLRYAIRARDLPLFSDDTRAPWLLVPPDTRRALLRMQQAPAIGARNELRIRRGVVTGANELLLLTHADRKLGGLSVIRSAGHAAAAAPRLYEGVVESDAVAPVLRGCDVGAWTCRRERFVLRRPPHNGSSYRRLARYLAGHGRTLADVPKVDDARPMVAWHDLASTLEAVVVPDAIVALNTVYFIEIDGDAAHVLCAYLNSLPVRTFARAIAERAKDAHFRFFAWTVSMLPLPAQWRSFQATRLCELARAAHAAGSLEPAGQAELDALIASAYSLGRADVSALRTFDEWLSP